HDAAPGADVQERHGVERSLPDLIHHSAPKRGHVVQAREPEATLDLWLQSGEIWAKGAPVYGAHEFSEREFRRQRAAEGRLPRTVRSITAREATARFNDTGLKAAPRYCGE